MNAKPVGIIKTLPTLYADKVNVARQRFLRSLELLNAGKLDQIYIALAARPRQEVLYMYLLVEGSVVCRLNIAAYESGEDFTVKCWDDVDRRAKWWAVCTGPVKMPPEPVRMRGFQGIRYTEGLW